MPKCFAVPLLLVLLAPFLACPRAAASPRLERAVLALQWQPQAQFAGYYVALVKGFYRDAGVDMVLAPGGPSVSSSGLLAAHRAAFATLFLAKGIECRAKGVPVVNLAQLGQHSSLMLVARANDGVRTPRDLDGRRVSLWSNEFGLPARVLFRRLGIHPKIIPQSGTLNLFLRGGVAAASAMWYNEYYTLYASGLDPDELVTFSFRDLGLDFPEDGLYALGSTVANRPGLCRAVVRASLRGWKYAFAHPDEALSIVLKARRAAHLPTSLAHQRFMLARIRDVILGRPGETPPPMGRLDRTAFERVERVLWDQKQISSRPAFADFVWEGWK